MSTPIPVYVKRTSAPISQTITASPVAKSGERTDLTILASGAAQFADQCIADLAFSRLPSWSASCFSTLFDRGKPPDKKMTDSGMANQTACMVAGLIAHPSN